MLKRTLITSASVLIATALLMLALQAAPVQSSTSSTLPQPGIPHQPEKIYPINFGGALGTNYSPAEVRISPEDSVQWLGDFAMHPLVSDDGLWQTVNTGSQFTHTFDQPGVYPYHCFFHSVAGMKGTVRVGYYGYIPLIIR